MVALRGARAEGERGAELVEFALVLPFLLVLVLSVIDFGLLFQRYQILTNAAREGARIAVLPAYSTADVTARVNSYLSAGGVPGSATTTVEEETVTTPSGATLNIVKVTVNYTHPMGFLTGAISLIGGSTGPMTLRASASMRREVAAGGGG